MKKRLLLLLVIIIYSSSFPQDIRVKFTLTAPTLAETSKVYITGDIPQLGSWQPAAVPMNYRGNNQWVKEIAVKDIRPVEYKYTLGSWEREGADNEGTPLRNFSISIKSDIDVYDTVLVWTTRSERINKGQITGTVKYHRNIQSEGIAERDLIVWLPDDYDASTESYPVLYMHDGQNIFDPVTSSFGIDWQVDESVDSLIKHQVISPLIVVGINNSSERMREYLPGEKGEAYMNFIVEKVKPIIDSIYRTKKEREYTYTGGSSAGGTISFMLLWEYPQVFSGALCMSPAFKEPGERSRWNYVEKVRKDEKREDVKIYIDTGGKGIDIILQEGIDEMVEVLKDKGYTEGGSFMYVRESEAEHTESAWAARFPEAIRFVHK